MFRNLADHGTLIDMEALSVCTAKGVTAAQAQIAPTKERRYAPADCSLFSLSIEKGTLAVAKRPFSPIPLFRDPIWSQKNRFGKELALQGTSGPKGVIGQHSFGMSATPRQPHCSAAGFTSEQ
ncbi:hypothetical protein QN397_24055 [Variovorax sp. RTB1]|uniref:hypothetical protein n=1 Tax=Variovorax sp. RTB1 TaxID=3048631 RepID=UPI002B231D1A|nr:hypothetical protein [Variovorax sp. RTB1]MEB0114358.1 hypothetical protein [Variovorax sp. RTB1]